MTENIQNLPVKNIWGVIIRAIITILSAISALVASLPSSCISCLLTLDNLCMVSTICTGILIVLAWSAIALVIDCLIHHVA